MATAALLENILERGVAGGRVVVADARRAVVALARRLPELGRPELMRRARRLLLAREPLLARVLRDAQLAAWLEAARLEARPLVPISPEPPPQLPSPFGPAPLGTPPDPPPVVFFASIERASADLARRRVFTVAAFDQLADSAKRTAITIARVTTQDALAAVRDALASDVAQGGTLREFRTAVADALESSGLSDSQVEAIYRTQIGRAQAGGLRAVLDAPLVASEFPYVEYVAVHDARARPEHRQMEKLGIQGTAIYRRDDPIWDEFWPPWAWNCRCHVIPLTLDDAARRGIREAIVWKNTGIPPEHPAWVEPPPFSPPPGWVPTRPALAVAL